MTARGPNIIVMSSAGKPIFSKYGTDEDMVQLCALAQTIRATSLNLTSCHPCRRRSDIQGAGGGQDIRCLVATGMKVVFMNVGHLTLMAVSYEANKTCQETQLYLHLLLEYMNSQIVFILTDQIQNIFVNQPNFDMRSLLGATKSVLTGIVESVPSCAKTSPTIPSMTDQAYLLTCGIEVASPLTPAVRHHASEVLLKCTRNIPHTLYAILLCGGMTLGDKGTAKGKDQQFVLGRQKYDKNRTTNISRSRQKLVTFVQTPIVAHQLHTTDLKLVMNFVQHQPGLLATSGEAWVPLCLPRLDPSGFIYGYFHRIDPTPSSDLTLILVSGQGTQEQFDLFRRASQSIQLSLGIEPVSPASPTSDVGTASSASTVGEELNAAKVRRRSGAYHLPRLSDEVASRVNNSTEQDKGFEDYHGVADSLHFCFRYNVPTYSTGGGPVVTPSTGKSSSRSRKTSSSKAVQYYGKTITQTLAPSSFKLPLGLDVKAQQEMWVAYQKLALRLRYGSATDEAILAEMDRLSRGLEEKANAPGKPLDEQRRCRYISKCAVAQEIFSTLPDVHNVTYVIDHSKCLMYVGLCANHLELFVTLPATRPPSRCTALCAKLVGKIMSHKEKIFMNTVLTYPIIEPPNTQKEFES